MSDSAIRRVRLGHVLDIAEALRLPFSRHPRNRSIYGCPACGAQRRHPREYLIKGAIEVRYDGRAWQCCQCLISGDALDLVAYVLRGKRSDDLRLADWDEVTDWCERYASTAPKMRPGLT